MNELFPLWAPWEVRSLSDLCSGADASIQTGPFGSQLHASDYVEVGTPCVMPQDIKGGRISTESIARISEEDLLRLCRFQLRRGDIVYPRRGDISKRALVGERETGWLCGTGCLRIRSNASAVDPAFLANYLSHPEVCAWIEGNAVGATMPHLNTGLAAAIPVVCPPIEEQREIAAILGALDDKIELNRKKAATLEEMARALYRSWFVDFDPVHAKAAGRTPAHMDATTAALFPDNFGEDGLPEGWSAEPFIDQALWVNGAAYKNMHFSTDADALPVIKIAELKAGVTANTKFTATDLGDRYRISRGELLFSWSGNPDTSIDAFVWPLGDAWLNQHIFAVRDNGRMSRAALFCALRYFKPEMAEIARNKQTIGLGHITRKDLEAFPVSVPPETVETAFETQVAPLFDRYCACLYENQTLATLRDTLLPRLMSGELRVGEAKEQVVAVA
ncbi:restriction endonuclease subunit S [Meridianimarinicoccus aquatilis]|uniref:Restriction endonuclease subunit S n=1 Tax=Meridianimarinicoccus aquatilis TaxID=2552766 RepID=A0A4R6APR9_9RHOB|nr:restriction endonuclease subunit S [Fluviibacterium aquatile]TDL86070.1 restriction endonuclease subunit S [Fluviibacterium aquatile]